MNVKYGIHNEFRIFYLIHLQNEKDEHEKEKLGSTR